MMLVNVMLKDSQKSDKWSQQESSKGNKLSELQNVLCFYIAGLEKANCFLVELLFFNEVGAFFNLCLLHEHSSFRFTKQGCRGTAKSLHFSPSLADYRELLLS